MTVTTVYADKDSGGNVFGPSDPNTPNTSSVQAASATSALVGYALNYFNTGKGFAVLAEVTQYILLHFNLSGIASSVNVSAAELGTCLSTAQTEAGTIRLNRLSSSFAETDGSAFPSLSGSVTGYRNPHDSAGSYEIWTDAALLTMVQGWISGSLANHGVAIEPDGTNYGADSVGNPATNMPGYLLRENGGPVPYLTVTYTASFPQTVSPTGIASAQAMGTPTIVKQQFLLPSGIDSSQAMGAHTVAPGVVSVSPAGIASGQAMGTPLVDQGRITLPSIASAESLGAPTIIRGTVVLSPAGIASGQAMGSHTIYKLINLSPAGIASAQAMGVPTVVVGALTVSPTGIASAQAMGSHTLLPGAVTLSPAGIASAQAMGAPAIYALIALSPAGIASAQAMGLPTIMVGTVLVALLGIPSAEAMGNLVIMPPGIAWIEDGVFHLSVRLVPAYSMEVQDTHGEMQIIRNWGSVELGESSA